MEINQLLDRAKQFSQRARPLESNFPVGAFAEFSDGTTFGGANIEDFRKTTIGACAERALIAAANSSESGPLSKDGGIDSRPIWTRLAVWAPTEQPITPCGICRDSLSGTSASDSEVFSTGSLGQNFRSTIRELLPLPGLGRDGDILEELELFRLRGATVTTTLSYEQRVLMAQAIHASSKSYIPPFSREPRAGAALETADGRIQLGWFSTDATTRLGGSAIANAVRGLLASSRSRGNAVIRAALYTEGNALRAPSGADLQLLKEVADDQLGIVVSCDIGERFTLELNELLPYSFGPKDLGY